MAVTPLRPGGLDEQTGLLLPAILAPPPSEPTVHLPQKCFHLGIM